MNERTTEIKNYILFLKKECRLDISLHPQPGERFICESELFLFNIHENSHCIFVKSFSKAKEHCMKAQKTVCETCRSGSFFGTCYAGVTEYVYPVFYGNTIECFICVSGYAGEYCESYLNRCSEKYGIPVADLKKSAMSLKREIPNKSYVDTLIMPLVRMLESVYESNAGGDEGAAVGIEKVVNYVNRHYTEDVTLKELCEKFSYSRSYMSHNFSKYTGTKFREYVTVLRLKTARSLLCHSNLTVTETALSVGFSDPNYFSKVFRSEYGLAPREYRKKWTEGKNETACR